LSRLQET